MSIESGKGRLPRAFGEDDGTRENGGREEFLKLPGDNRPALLPPDEAATGGTSRFGPFAAR